MSDNFVQLVTKNSDQGKRLDLFLKENLNLSRARIQSLIKNACIRHEGNILDKSSHKLAANIKLEITIPEIKESTIEAEDIAIKILYEDEDILIIDKDAGQVVHPAAGHESGTLVNALLFHCQDLSGIGGEKRPGIVHRLDKGTSGLILIAKNENSHQDLSSQFKNRSINKTYQAFCLGVFSKNTGRIEFPIGRSPHDRKKMGIQSKQSREALTDFKVLKQYDQMAWVELYPKTGRTHQLRVHLKAIHHPILCDPEYGEKLKFIKKMDPRIIKILSQHPYQLLHACKIDFMHPHKKRRMIFESPLRDEMQNLIQILEE